MCKESDVTVEGGGSWLEEVGELEEGEALWLAAVMGEMEGRLERKLDEEGWRLFVFYRTLTLYRVAYLQGTMTKMMEMELGVMLEALGGQLGVRKPELRMEAGERGCVWAF